MAGAPSGARAAAAAAAPSHRVGFREVATAASGRRACGACIVRGHTRVYMEDLVPKPWVVPALLYREV